MIYRFPRDTDYLPRTKLSYVNLPGILSDGKRDRQARVPGYVAVQLGERCFLIFMREGEPFYAARITPQGRGPARRIRQAPNASHAMCTTYSPTTKPAMLMTVQSRMVSTGSSFAFLGLVRGRERPGAAGVGWDPGERYGLRIVPRSVRSLARRRARLQRVAATRGKIV